MFQSQVTAILGLSLIFNLQPIFELRVRSQPLANLEVTARQNSTCQSQRMRLLKASDGLFYSSESDYPFEYFSNYQTSSLPSPQQFTSLIGQSGQQVTQVDFDDFFNQLIRNLHSSGAEASTLRRYQVLRQVLKNQFTNLRVYRVGKIEVQVYIAGVNSACGMGGLKTISIET